MKFDWNNHYKTVAVYAIRIIEKYFPKLDYNGKKILDVGCWWGWYMRYARDKGAVVEGFDYDSERINHAIEFIGDEGLRTADAQDIPRSYKDRDYDIVFSWHVMEHLQNQDGMLRGVHRVLKDDGDFILAIPREYSLRILPYRPFRWLVDHKPDFLRKHNAYHFFKSISYCDITHEREYTKKSVFQVLQKNQFDVVSINSYGFELPYPFDKVLGIRKKFFLSWLVGRFIPPWWREAFLIHAKKNSSR